MLRKLSSALSLERPVSPRIHPAAAVPPADGGEAAAAAEAAAAEAAAAEEADGLEAPSLRAESLRATYGYQPTVSVVVQQEASEGGMPDSRATHPAPGEAEHTAAAAEQGQPPPLPPPPVRVPVVALTVAAGDVAAAAAAAPAGGRQQAAADGGTPIAAYKRRGQRISFADVPSISPPPPPPAAAAGPAKPAPLQPTGPPSHAGPRKSLTRTSLLGGCAALASLLPPACLCPCLHAGPGLPLVGPRHPSSCAGAGTK